MRVLWWLAGLVVGLLAGGIVAGLVVPFAVRAGVTLGPWFMWVVLAGCAAGGIWLGERIHRGRSAR